MFRKNRFHDFLMIEDKGYRKKRNEELMKDIKIIEKIL